MSLFNTKEKREIEHKAWLLNRCQNQTYWIRQDFVKEFVDGYLRGENTSVLRDRFDQQLEYYVTKRCAEKLEQAQRLVSEIEKVSLNDPFSAVRTAISNFKGER